MGNNWRRYEVLLPLQYNDGREVPRELLAEASQEIAKHFGADSYETQKVEGQWRSDGFIFRENMVRLFVDVPDNETSRAWMKDFKARWKDRLQQLDLWMVSHSIEVE